MSNSADEQKAWTYQNEFLSEARELIRRVFLRLGIEESLPLLGLAALGWWKDGPYNHPPFAKIDPRMQWKPRTDEWRDATSQKSDSISDAKKMRVFFERALESTVDFHNVLGAELRAHDANAGTRSFISEGAQVGSYDCIFVLECKRELVDEHSYVAPALSGDGPPLMVGLISAVITSLLDRLANEARKGNSGLGGWVGINERDADDVLRDAGDGLLATVQIAARQKIGISTKLFDTLNSIASLRYESSEPRASIVFGKSGSSGPFEIKFRKKVPLAETVWARKTIQLASKHFWVFSDTEDFLGVVKRDEDSLNPGEFWVRLKGQSRWALSVGDKPLAEVRFGIPSLPVQRLEEKEFTAFFERIFSASNAENVKQVWSLVSGVLDENHGALVVVTEQADKEAERLSAQATLIEPAQLLAATASRATAIDGAILLDPTGVCHGIGVILDGEAYPRGTPSRGARFNSALRYVMKKDEERVPCLAVVASEDGQVNLLPRMPPQIKMSEFVDFLRLFFLQEEDEPMPADFDDRCAKMIRHYLAAINEFIPDLYPELDEAGRKDLLKRALAKTSVFRRLGPLPQYDRYDSAFIDDLSKGLEHESSDDARSGEEGFSKIEPTK